MGEIIICSWHLIQNQCYLLCMKFGMEKEKPRWGGEQEVGYIITAIFFAKY